MKVGHLNDFVPLKGWLCQCWGSGNNRVVLSKLALIQVGGLLLNRYSRFVGDGFLYKS